MTNYPTGHPGAPQPVTVPEPWPTRLRGMRLALHSVYDALEELNQCPFCFVTDDQHYDDCPWNDVHMEVVLNPIQSATAPTPTLPAAVSHDPKSGDPAILGREKWLDQFCAERVAEAQARAAPPVDGQARASDLYFRITGRCSPESGVSASSTLSNAIDALLLWTDKLQARAESAEQERDRLAGMLRTARLWVSYAKFYAGLDGELFDRQETLKAIDAALRGGKEQTG